MPDILLPAWNDGGLQTNQITVPTTHATYTANFSTQYLLDTAVMPSGAGTITSAPTGSWYNAGQVVNLTASTNTSYRVSFWQGADTSTNNKAQVTMNGYHADPSYLYSCGLSLSLSWRTAAEPRPAT